MRDLRAFSARYIGLALLVAAACLDAAAQQSAVEFSTISAHLNQVADAALQGPQEAEQKPIAEGPGGERNAGGASNFKIAPSLRRIAPAVLPILLQRGLPADLTAVMVTESHGDPEALSPKGARGLWQLMPATARRYGLVVNDRIDERIDPVRSTAAAASYLHDLYEQFGSWPLALAAYNWGEQNLAAALIRTHAADFSALVQAGALPAETRDYVPAVLARWRPNVTAPAFSPTTPTDIVFATVSSATHNQN
jgi:soluble lytic murein transglycosylase-like protein